MNNESLPVSGVCEIALEMNDLEAGERFYSGILGFPVVERWSARGGAIWVMAADRTRIGLWRPQLGLGGGRGGVHVHYAMHLPAKEYDAAVHGRGRAAYVTDPGGHVVELWTWDVAEHLKEHARGESPGSN